MVILSVKRGDEVLFLFETSVNEKTDSVLRDLVALYNGQLKIQRVCMEIEELAEHGTMLPGEMIGLNEEQREELKLKDVWADKCIPSGGFTINKDPLLRRNGQQPSEAMQKVLANAITDAKAMVDRVSYEVYCTWRYHLMNYRTAAVAWDSNLNLFSFSVWPNPQRP